VKQYFCKKHLRSDEANSALACAGDEQYVALEYYQRMLAAGGGVTAVAAAVRADDYPAIKRWSTLRVILNDWTDERLVAANESVKWMNRPILISALPIAMLAVGAVSSSCTADEVNNTNWLTQTASYC
jgi:hypothetical protein